MLGTPTLALSPRIPCGHPGPTINQPSNKTESPWISGSRLRSSEKVSVATVITLQSRSYDRASST